MKRFPAYQSHRIRMGAGIRDLSTVDDLEEAEAQPRGSYRLHKLHLPHHDRCVHCSAAIMDRGSKNCRRSLNLFLLKEWRSQPMAPSVILLYFSRCRSITFLS